MKGKLLIAQSRKDKKEEGLKAFFYPKGPQGNLGSTRGLLQKVVA